MQVDLRGVSHRYRSDVTVLDGVDLTVESGEVVAVKGPSGSGKSTLLAIMGLVTAPTHGRVFYDGQHALLREGARRLGSEVAWLFQDNNVLGGRTAIDNVALGLLASGTRWRQARVRAGQALELVGLGGRGLDRVTNLSGGESQRVGVARLLAQQPRLLLCDEPTAQLDRSNSQMVFAALNAVRETSTTVVIASHDPMVSEVVHRELELRDGRLRGSQT